MEYSGGLMEFPIPVSQRWGFHLCGVLFSIPLPSVCVSLDLESFVGSIYVGERLLLNHAKTLGFLAPRGEEFNPGPEI